ncbi:UNVERIFIED_CONTAM: hypothetical protein FKN15_064758 [Acipenser sinensis]
MLVFSRQIFTQHVYRHISHLILIVLYAAHMTGKRSNTELKCSGDALLQVAS